MRNKYFSTYLSKALLIFLILLFVWSGVYAEELKDDISISTAGAGQAPSYGSYGYSDNVISGFLIRYGTGFSGITEANWLVSLGYDFGIAHNFAIGIEIMPSYFSVEDSSIPFKQTGIPFNAFINAKGGFHLGGLIPFLKFLKFFAGAGGGVGSLYTTFTYAGDKLQKITFDPAFHVLGGVELDFGVVSLIAEYQRIKVLAKNVDPDPWLNYLIIGLRF